MVSLDAIVLIIYALGQLSGTVYLAMQVKEMKKMMGNGEPGIFVRRAELVLMKDKADGEHEVFEKRIDKLEAWKESVKPPAAV